MTTLLVILLLIHGIAHLVGFVVPWKLTDLPDAPYKTTLVNGKWDVGDSGIRFFGILWLLAGVGFVICAILVWIHFPRWILLTGVMSVFSLALSVLSLPEARIGIPVNMILIVGLAAHHLGWF